MARVRINRNDPRRGAGPSVGWAAKGDAELVTPNGLVWNEGHMGRIYSEPSTNPYPHTDSRWRGNRASMTGLGGNRTVNQPVMPATTHGGNDSGD